MKRHFIAFVALAAFFASAAFAQNSLTVSSSSLTFNATVNAAPPQAATVTVNSTSTSPVFYSVSVTPANQWLSVAQPSAATPSVLSISVNHSGLAVGQYFGYVLINASGVTNPQTQITVTLNVVSASQLVANPSPLVFPDIAAGSTQPVVQNLTVSAGVPVPFRASAIMNTGSGWLSVSPDTATTPSTLQVTVNPTNLAVGTYTGRISLTPIGGISAVDVSVTVNIISQPRLVVTPASLTFNWKVNTNPPPAQTLDVSASNGGALPVTIEASPAVPWLLISPSSTTTRSAITIAVNQFYAQVQTANKTKLLIKSTGASNSPLEVPVTLNVSTSDLLTASPSGLSFTYQNGATLPAAQKVNVGSTGAALTYITAVDALWLSAPLSGTSGAEISIGLNQGGLIGLAPGTYNGTVTLTATGSPIPLQIPVQLTITNFPMLVSDRPGVIFNYQLNGAAPAAQRMNITSTGAQLTYSANVATTSGGSWLSIDAPTGTTPGGFNVSVNTTGLAEGVYYGAISVTAPGSANTLNIRVTLYVSPRPLLNVDPYAVVLTAQRNGGAVTKEILLTSTATEQLAFTAVKEPGADWLSLAGTTSGLTAARIVVTALPTLVPDVGTYTGTITVTATVGIPPVPIPSSPIKIPVTLNVTSGALSVATNSLNFRQVSGGAAPAAQTVAVTNSIGASTFTASASITGTVNWLTVAPASGTTPGNLTVSVNPAGLQAGTYNGTVTVAVPGAANSPQNIQVTYTIEAPTLSVTPPTLSFTQNVGAVAPSTQKLTVSSGGVPVNFTAAVTAGSNWLTVTPTTGTTPTDLTVSVNAASLAPGSYTGAITIGTATIVVNLTVSPAQSLVVSPTALTFTAQAGGTAPAAQSIQVASSGAQLAFTVNMTTSPGTGWMTVSPTSGNTPGAISVGINPANLAAGNYTGTVLVVSPAATNTPQTVTVNLTVQPPPAPGEIVVRHAATGAPGAVSPGLLVSIYGTRLGPATPVQSKTATGNMETTLGETRVFFDDIPAPLWYVSSTQINAIVPYEVAGRPTVRFQVEYRGTRSTSIALTVSDTLPGIFTQNQSGSGPGSILNQDYSVNTNGRPAARGSIVAVYATGEGATVPAGQTGLIIPANGSLLKNPVGEVTATVGGRTARVVYSGSAPGAVSGVFQVNVQIPDDAPSGAQAIVIKVGNNSGPAGVTVAVQ